MRKSYLSALVLLLLLSFAGCNTRQENKQSDYPVIALSKSYDTYQEWLLASDSAVEFINLYGLPVSEAIEKLSLSDGIVVTGGEDIHPDNYGRAGDTTLCNTINTYRDSLDAAIVTYASREGIPLLGICRGMQMMNVALGGSLYADIPTQYPGKVAHRMPEFEDTLHTVTVNQASLLHLIGDEYQAEVISNHHQGVRELAPDLRVVAKADDDLTEALEWKEPAGKGFMLGVQFHPERHSSKLSAAISKHFTEEVKRYHLKKSEKAQAE
jgi:putative glutamine amidotransferase